MSPVTACYCPSYSILQQVNTTFCPSSVSAGATWAVSTVVVAYSSSAESESGPAWRPGFGLLSTLWLSMLQRSSFKSMFKMYSTGSVKYLVRHAMVKSCFSWWGVYVWDVLWCWLKQTSVDLSAAHRGCVCCGLLLVSRVPSGLSSSFMVMSLHFFFSSVCCVFLKLPDMVGKIMFFVASESFTANHS